MRPSELAWHGALITLHLITWLLVHAAKLHVPFIMRELIRIRGKGERGIATVDIIKGE